MEDLKEPILISLVFDPMLKPDHVGGLAFACDGCVAWHHKSIHFLVPPQMKTLQDLAEVIRRSNGIQSKIILSSKGSVLPLDLPCKVLTMITGPIDVLPMRPIVKVVAPKCTCAAAAAEVLERMISQFGDSNIDELNQPSSNSAEMVQKSGTLKRAAGESHLDEIIEMDERDVGMESSLSSSKSEGVDLGNRLDGALMNTTEDHQSTTPTAMTSNGDGPGLTPDSSVCTLGSEVYDADKQSTEKSTEDMEAVSMQSTQEKESPEETGEELNDYETWFIPNQGQLASTKTTGSSAWTTVTPSSNEKWEQLDEKQNEVQAGNRSEKLDDSSDDISGDVAVETGGVSTVGLQDGAGASMMETKAESEEKSENLATESVDMLDDSAPSTTNTTSSAKRPSISMSVEEFGRVLKKPRMMTGSVKQILLQSLILNNVGNMVNNLDSEALSENNFPLTSTPNTTVDFSAAYGGGEREATGATCSDIEKTEDWETETSTENVTKD